MLRPPKALLHAPVSLAALQAGKHVLLDKPFALSYAEAKRVVDAVYASSASGSIRPRAPPILGAKINRFVPFAARKPAFPGRATAALPAKGHLCPARPPFAALGGSGAGWCLLLTYLPANFPGT
jgi:hypothetical protein